MARAAHWDDLPANVRHRIQEHRAQERAKAKPALPGQRRWQCCACPVVFTSWAAAERHADEIGHRRIELILDERDRSE